MTLNSRTLRIGTRGSLLARTQTDHIAETLRVKYPQLQFVVNVIQTTGDIRRDIPFAQVGTKGMFVKEIEEALLANEIDLGVHSLKDMPGQLPDGLTLACVPEREDPHDALLSRHYVGLTALPPGSIIGTSSVRRQAQLRNHRPDLEWRELRGNLDTRLRKLDEGRYDAIVLACAGLNRLGMGERIAERLSPDICVPAVGQGALALETRAEDHYTSTLLAALHDPDTADAVAAERGFQFALAGGCTIPAGALAVIASDQVSLLAVIASPDGSEALIERASAHRTQAHALGIQTAERLLERGGDKLLKYR